VLRRWWHGAGSSDATDLVWELDNDGPQDVRYTNRPRPNNASVSTPYQREIAYAFKAKNGEMKYNAANRLIAGDFVRKYMADNKDMRDFDKVKLMAVAVELCLLPMAGAVAAAELARSSEFSSRRQAINAPR